MIGGATRHSFVRAYLTRAGCAPVHVGAFDTPRSAGLCYALFRSHSASDTDAAERVIVLLTGMNESFVFYTNEIAALLRCGFHVAAMDHANQGLSQPQCHSCPSRSERAIHAQEFDDYVTNAGHFIRVAQRKLATDAHVTVLGHSMGGLVALRLSDTNHLPIGRVVALSPMLAVRIPFGVPQFVMECAAACMCAAGRGKELVWMRRNRIRRPIDVDNPYWNDLTHCRAALLRIGRAHKAFPDTYFAGPSFGWVRTASRALRHTWARATRRRLAQNATPTLVLTAGADTYVDSHAARRFCADLPHVAHLELPHAFHNLLLEDTPTRDIVLEHIVDFALRGRSRDIRKRPQDGAATRRMHPIMALAGALFALVLALAWHDALTLVTKSV